MSGWTVGVVEVEAFTAAAQRLALHGGRGRRTGTAWKISLV